jgi:hypothetical protein
MELPQGGDSDHAGLLSMMFAAEITGLSPALG